MIKLTYSGSRWENLYSTVVNFMASGILFQESMRDFLNTVRRSWHVAPASICQKKEGTIEIAPD